MNIVFVLLKQWEKPVVNSEGDSERGREDIHHLCHILFHQLLLLLLLKQLVPVLTIASHSQPALLKTKT